jgi:hypothetical protein
MWNRIIYVPLILLLSAGLAQCTSGDTEGTTEPVAPEADANTGYPEDPDLGPPSGEAESSVEEPKTPEEDTPGELTDDPYGALPDQENKENPDDIMTDPNPPEVDIPDAEADNDITGAFEDPPPTYQPTPGGGKAGKSVKSGKTGKGKSQVASSAPGKGKQTMYVKAILLNVREKPSHKSTIVRRLLGGAKINVEIQGSFAKIRNGQWVNSKYLSTQPTTKRTWSDVQAAWKKSKYQDTWKPKK